MRLGRSMDPYSPYSYITMSYYYDQNADPTSALRELEAAVAIAQDIGTIYSNMAAMHIRARQFDKARLAAQKAVNLEPKNVKFKILLALSLDGLERFEDEDDVWRDAVELNAGAIIGSLGFNPQLQSNPAIAYQQFTTLATQYPHLRSLPILRDYFQKLTY